MSENDSEKPEPLSYPADLYLDGFLLTPSGSFPINRAFITWHDPAHTELRPHLPRELGTLKAVLYPNQVISSMINALDPRQDDRKYKIDGPSWWKWVGAAHAFARAMVEETDGHVNALRKWYEDLKERLLAQKKSKKKVYERIKHAGSLLATAEHSYQSLYETVAVMMKEIYSLCRFYTGTCIIASAVRWDETKLQLRLKFAHDLSRDEALTRIQAKFGVGTEEIMTSPRFEGLRATQVFQRSVLGRGLDEPAHRHPFVNLPPSHTMPSIDNADQYFVQAWNKVVIPNIDAIRQMLTPYHCLPSGELVPLKMETNPLPRKRKLGESEAPDSELIDFLEDTCLFEYGDVLE
uniref:Uncharacterized protein n=1 Tax=viral metagenome TaxID=1070528 RepID=A0A2V0RJ08_9ZZZZ